MGAPCQLPVSGKARADHGAHCPGRCSGRNRWGSHHSFPELRRVLDEGFFPSCKFDLAPHPGPFPEPQTAVP
jgi:hypothetical protein